MSLHSAQTNDQGRRNLATSESNAGLPTNVESKGNPRPMPGWDFGMNE